VEDGEAYEMPSSTDYYVQSSSDDDRPNAERQAELGSQFQSNVAAGNAPYAGVRITTRGELNWIMAQHGWQGESRIEGERADLRGADFRGADLRNALLYGANLQGAIFSSFLSGGQALWEILRDVPAVREGRFVPADFQLADLSVTSQEKANLHGAVLDSANLRDATLFQVDLSGASLSGTDCANAMLREANLNKANCALANFEGADLKWANLTGADLSLTNLGGADLRGARMDVATLLVVAKLNERSLVSNVAWNGVQLSRIVLPASGRLGDERLIREASDSSNRKQAVEAAVQAYNGLEGALRAQGLRPQAIQYRYRAKVLERQSSFTRRNYSAWLLSLIAGVTTGYGTRIGRLVPLYLTTIVSFALVYYADGHLTPLQALATSLLVFHASSVIANTSGLMPSMPASIALVAAVEFGIGVIGYGVFISVLVRLLMDD
jgi:uncharacterized protein YjbI with pentapeptide repeats